MSAFTDSQLITRYLDGDKQAFGELVERYQNYVYNLAFRFSGNIADAEDLTQEVFLLLMRKVGQWRREAKFSTWLYRVTANLCLERLRGVRETVPLEDYEPPASDNPVQEAEVADFHVQIQRVLLEIPPDYRAAVVLRDINGLSYDEVAAVLELAPGTVRSRISRGRALLAEKLRPALELKSGADRQNK